MWDLSYCNEFSWRLSLTLGLRDHLHINPHDYRQIFTWRSGQWRSPRGIRKMNQRAFWKYYRDFNLYNLMFSVFSGIYFGLFSGLLVFLSFGMLIGYLGFNYFKKNEYYLYYNLGFSKKFLLKEVWMYNFVFVGPVLLIIFLFLWVGWR